MYKSPVTRLHPRTTLLFKLSIMTSALASLGFMTGCSTTPTKTTTAPKSVKSQYTLLDASSLDSLEELLSASDMRAVEGDRLLVLKYGDIWKRITVGFKMDLDRRDSRINAQRSWFISRQPYLDRLSARASRYLYHTVKEAERRGLPTELALLPIIESSYDPAATSTAAAAGLWQFIPSTGKIYGLQQTTLYDGRRDVVESTRAAYEFLGSLYNQFGSWELALAAYNAGPGRIQQAINRNKAAGLPTDYWSLRLPEETMNYVPRFLAVAQIINNPSAYNVRLPPIANRPHFREVRVPANTDLNQIASTIGISRAELYALNPGYRGDRVDPASPMRILVPADVSGLVDKKLIALKPVGGSTWASSRPPENLSAVISQPVPYTPPAQTLATVKQTPPALNSASANTRVVTSPSTTTQVTVKPSNTTTTTTVTTTVQASTATKPSASSVSTVPVKPATTTPTITASTTQASTVKRVNTPLGASALAQFAASADVPSAPRIPVAVKPAASVQPVRVEPPISAAEREKIVASIAPEVKKAPVEAAKVVDELLEPTATEAQKQEVVAELKAIAPAGTEVVDPYDGKINITAIQTSQSIAAQKGEEVKKGFSYPNELVAATANSEEAARNQGKNVVKTDDAVLVVPPKGKRSTYTIQPGDTLAIIAMKNGVSWRDVANWNQIDPNAYLYPGASLYLYDAKPPADVVQKPTSYVVQANDNLTGVADKFGLTLRDLAAWNGLTIQSGLRVGQKLSLVETEQKPPIVTAVSPRVEDKATPAKIDTVSYQVKRGEFLKLIAERYGLSNQELASLTPGLTATSALLVGQRINVPQAVVAAGAEQVAPRPYFPPKETPVATKPTTEAYRVQRGETLSSIANTHELSVAELASLNAFSAQTRLQAGQTIQVPVSVKIPEFYVVQAGDTLTGVANKFELNMQQLAQLNGMNTQAGLRVGQRLRLTGTPAASVQTVNSTPTEPTKAKTEQPVPVVNSTRNTESYRVRAGESLNAIAPRYGLSVKELADLNGLSARAGLQVGQSIQVPKLVVEYKVRRGDTLIGLAARHGIEVSALADMNDVSPKAQLRIGDVIKVPN